MVEDAIEGIGAAFEQTCAAGLFPFVLSLSRLCVGVDLNDTVRMVDGTLGVGADSACTSCAFAVDDDCSLDDSQCVTGSASSFSSSGREISGYSLRESVPGRRSFGERSAVSICTNSGRAATFRLTCSVSLT